MLFGTTHSFLTKIFVIVFEKKEKATAVEYHFVWLTYSNGSLKMTKNGERTILMAKYD